VAFVGTLVMASTALASRPPTRGEEDDIKFAFREAHYNSDDGLSLRSVRKIRVSVVDDRWAVVLYSKPRRGSKKPGREFYRAVSDDNWKKKRKPPRPVAADLKQPAERYLVDIRYRGSGSFRYDYDDDVEGANYLGDAHLAADFSWDLTWDDVELYDDHYPGGHSTPDTANIGGTYTYSYADDHVIGAPYSCSASGQLLSGFEGWVRTDRGHQVAVIVESPVFENEGGFSSEDPCQRDIWRDITVEIPDHGKYPSLSGVPMFPTAPIEETVLSDDKCAPTDDPARTNCTLALSGKVTITPP
jgi:hypothetical protein